jgi:hypothetical protein
MRDLSANWKITFQRYRQDIQQNSAGKIDKETGLTIQAIVTADADNKLRWLLCEASNGRRGQLSEMAWRFLYDCALRAAPGPDKQAV